MTGAPAITETATLTPQERSYRRFALRVALCIVSTAAGVLAASWWLR